MKPDVFDELLASAREALAHASGKQVLRTTVLPRAPKPMSAADIQALRQRVNASQAVFAHFLNVSTKLVQAWEANRRQPEGAALRLLELAVQEPTHVFRGLTVSTPMGRPRVASGRTSSTSARHTATDAATLAEGAQPERKRKRV